MGEASVNESLHKEKLLSIGHYVPNFQADDDEGTQLSRKGESDDCTLHQIRLAFRGATSPLRESACGVVAPKRVPVDEQGVETLARLYHYQPSQRNGFFKKPNVKMPIPVFYSE